MHLKYDLIIKFKVVIGIYIVLSFQLPSICVRVQTQISLQTLGEMLKQSSSKQVILTINSKLVMPMSEKHFKLQHHNKWIPLLCSPRIHSSVPQ